jgi:thiol-disulfide isomerase/thioredoxin
MTFKPALLPMFLSSLLVLSACSGDGAGTTAGASASDVPGMIAAAAADPNQTMYQDLQGQGFDISAFKGKKVFVNYWATWCAPCIREIPSIAEAAATLEPENYVFLLASDEKPEDISAFLADRGFTGNFVKLNGYFGGHGIDAVPSSLLYDEQGNLVKTWAGAFEWNTPQMLAEIRGGATAP